MVPTKVQQAQQMGQAVVAAGASMGSISAILSTSSSQGAWSSINQFQLYLLVPLIGATIHENVLMFLEGFEFSAFSLSFINFDWIPGFGTFISVFPDTENNQYFESLGAQYTSTFRNMLGTLTMMLCIGILHLVVVLPLHIKAMTYGFTFWFRVWMEPVFLFFTFTIYLRIILESYVTLCLSSLKEIWWSYLSFGVLFFVVACSCVIIFFYMWNRVNKNMVVVSESYFKEFFSGLKDNKVAKLYFSGFILRRLLSVVIVVVSQPLPLMVRISLFASVQVIVTSFTLIVRPFESIKDNMVESIND